MSKVRVKIKRTVAAFLAFCMLLSSFNGVAWADTGSPDDDYYPESRDVVFKLDANQMRSEAALAVQNGLAGQEAVTLDSLGLSAQNKSNVKNVYADLFADENSRIYEMMVPYAYDENNDENNNWLYEIPDGASMRMFVRVPYKVASSSNAGADEEYSLSGEENFLFLFINNSEYDLTFSVEVNNRRTKPVEVPYKDSIAVKRATDSNPAFPGGASGQSTAVTAPTSTTVESSAVNPSETSPVESLDETAVSTEESSTDTDESSIEESAEDVSESSKESEAVSEEASSDKSTVAETTADSTETETTEAAEKSTEAATEKETKESAEATEKETEESAQEPEEEPAEASDKEDRTDEEAVTVSKSRHETVLVASAMEDGWEPQSPDEDPELMDDEDEEEYPGYLDEEGEAEEKEASVEMVAGTVLKAVLLGSEGSTGLFAAFIGNSGSDEGSARMTEVKGSDLLAAKETESPFKVTLYDYSGTDKSQGVINAYLGRGNNKIGDGFQFGRGSGPQNAFYDSDGNNLNIVQGITEPELSSEGTLINRYTKGDLFPSSQSGISPYIIKVYNEVNAEQLFVKNYDGYYEFDSSRTGGKYDASNNALVPLDFNDFIWDDYRNASDVQDGSKQIGFWPFKSNNWYFGMKVDFNFSVLEDGMYNGEEMEFEFRGDDDVWVYLTGNNDKEKGKIVLDVGGDHNVMGGTINFATGEIIYYRVNSVGNTEQVVSHWYNSNTADSNKMSRYNSDISPRAYLYTLEDAKKANPGLSESKLKSMYPLGFMGLNRQELTEYTLNFYYLERGGQGSNCYLRFNMPVIEKNEITLNKRVYSESDSDKTREYKFDLYYKTKGSSGFERYDKTITLTGDKNATKIIDQKFLEGTQYYFVERDNSASATRWTNSKENGLKSPTYVVGETNSVVCSNYFEVNPTVEKKANLISDSGYYDITLGVNGNTLSAEEGDEEAYLTKIVATDPLSEFVDFADYNDSEGPSLRLFDKTEEQALVSQKIVDGLYRYTLAGTDITIAYVDVNNKEIKWFVTKENDVTDTLKKGESKFLIYTVQTTDKAVYYGNENYPHVGESSTGTFAGEKGYYSNGNRDMKTAVLDSDNTIGGNIERLEFPQPVVRPTEKGVLTVTKHVVGENSIPDAWYKFDIQFLNRKGNPGLEEGQLVTATLVSGKAKLNTNDAEELNKGDAVTLKIGADGKLTVYMTADAEVKLNGILRGTECKVSEDLTGFDSLYYKTRLESVDKTVILADGTAKPVKADINDIGHKFDADSREEAKFVFNNVVEAVRMNLSITKQLVDEAGAPKKDIEDVSFVFKITDNDKNSSNLNNVFYKRISISAQKEKPENTITIYNLPYSQDYQVEEMGQMRYQVVGGSIQSAAPVKNGDGEFEAAVVFKNRKMEESLFSNTSVTTNKFVLNENGSYVFERNNDMPNDRLPQPEALVAYDLPRKPKTGNYGSDGFDDGDTQLV